MSRDYGFAPNPFHGACTLATCKPKLRGSAEIGDLVVACGAKANKLIRRIICVMRVDEKLSFTEYWNDPRFQKKKADFNGSRARAYGDNIYHKDAVGTWVQEKSHHSFKDGSTNFSNLNTDTRKDAVLISHDFVYWGGEGPMVPAELSNFHGEDLYCHVRDYFLGYSGAFVERVDEWFRQLPERGRRGRADAWK
jgi:hypothetical protein